MARRWEAGKSREGGLVGGGAAGCVQQDVRAPSFRRRLKKKKKKPQRTPTVGAHCVNSQWDHRWGKFEWHKQMFWQRKEAASA